MLERLTGNRRIVAPTKRGFVMALDRSDFVQQTIFAEGEYEPEVTREILSELRDDDVFYDIGANVGYYTCAALKNGVKSVHAFEPDPVAASVLRLNLRLNGLMGTSCQVMEMALGCRVGSGTFHRSHVSNSGRSGFRPVDAVASFEVPIETIDSLITAERAPAPTVLKVDVEGLEHEVLLGARRLLEGRPPRLIIFEAHHDLLASPGHPLSRYLRECGYVIEHLPRLSRIVEDVENYAARPVRPKSEIIASPAAEDRLPLVSVVVPMHNAGDRIAATLGSVIDQTYPRLELVLVDDGSEDNTRIAATRALRASPLPWRLIETPNQGPSKARNIGWRAAQGHLIQFLDDDDEIDPDKITHQVDWIANRTSKAAAIYSTWAIRNAANAGDGLVRRMRSVDWQIHDVIRGDSFLALGSCLIRRQWLEVVGGFDERLWLIEDVDLQIRILAAGGNFEEAETSGPLFFYNRRPQSLSQSDPAVFADACLRNARLVYSIASERGQLHPALIEAVSDVYRGAISTYAQVDRARFEAAYREFRSRFPGSVLQDAGRIRYFAGLMGERRAELLRGAVRRTRRFVRGMLPSPHRA